MKGIFFLHQSSETWNSERQNLLQLINYFHHNRRNNKVVWFLHVPFLLPGWPIRGFACWSHPRLWKGWGVFKESTSCTVGGMLGNHVAFFFLLQMSKNKLPFQKKKTNLNISPLIFLQRIPSDSKCPIPHAHGGAVRFTWKCMIRWSYFSSDTSMNKSNDEMRQHKMLTQMKPMKYFFSF